MTSEDKRFWYGLPFGALGAFVVSLGISGSWGITVLITGFYVVVNLVAKHFLGKTNA